jgi:hypothetical protein
LLLSSIDFVESNDPSIGEKVLSAAKTACLFPAVGALTICALNLLNIGSTEGAPSAMAIVRIPRGDIAMALPATAHPSPVRAATTGDASIIAHALVKAVFRFAADVVAHTHTAEVIVPIPPGDHAVAVSPVVAKADDIIAPVSVDDKTDYATGVSPVAAESGTDAAPARAAAKIDNGIVADLAAARHEDAVKIALPPPQTAAADVAQAAQDRQRANRIQEAIDQARDMATPDEASEDVQTPAGGLMQLASLESTSLPAAAKPTPADTQISLPQHIAVLPPTPPAGVPLLSPVARLHLVGAKLDRAVSCLAKAVYFEARDQPYLGQVAVAQVVMNRVFSGVYPRSVCGVIYQNAHHHLACQFTFACDGKSKAIEEPDAWKLAKRIASETLDGKLYVKAVGTATHYHAVYVHPRWVHEMRRYAREGEHMFYRPIAWGNGSNEPIWSSAELTERRENN